MKICVRACAHVFVCVTVCQVKERDSHIVVHQTCKRSLISGYKMNFKSHEVCFMKPNKINRHKELRISVTL